MAHAPPQPPDGVVYGYGGFDFDTFQDLTPNDQTTTGPPAGGGPSDLFPDGSTMMFDSAMLDSFASMPMNLDPADPSMAAQPLGSMDAGAPLAAGPLDAGPLDAGPLDAAASMGTGAAPVENPVTAAENQFNTAANNIPGAGPLPLGSFGQANAAGAAGSTLTEFTKRRNWPAKVIEEVRDLLQILDSNGRIKYASPSISQLLGYNPDDVQDRFLKDFIHPDDQGVFVAELNESIASGTPLRIFYRMKKSDQSYDVFEAIGHAHIAAAKFAPNPNNQSPFCQAVFMMARPYPTKNAGLLDSFLEHKIENERLKRRIADLRMEEDADNDEVQKQWLQGRGSRSEVSQSEVTKSSATPFSQCTGAESSGSHSERERSALNAALTRENLEGAVLNDSQPDSLHDKMNRYEGAYMDTIEMLTGLRYVEGERSKGITTGKASPTLIKGDAGIAIPMDRDPRTGEKKKKLKTSEEYVCTDCGTLDSPEWRKGPNGPKTLCNACGLRWAKKEKKKKTVGSDGLGVQMPSGPAAA